MRPRTFGWRALLIGAVCLVSVLSVQSGAGLAADPPSITYDLDGTPGTGGWWVSNVKVTWHISGDGLQSTTGCAPPTVIDHDAINAKLTCQATFDDGSGPTTISKTTVGIDIDVTPPDVSGSPDRQPDSADWYNQPVGVTFSGTDGTSGVNQSTCTSTVYSGPDDGSVRVDGSCADQAGNVGNAHLDLHYDATKPTVRAVPAREPYRYGWYNRALRVSFKGSDQTSGMANCTKTTYSGPTDGDASVTGTCLDAAGNTGHRTFRFKYAEPFLVPKRGSRVSKPPKLDWPTVAKAKFYNVQLWHKGKILSRWPRTSSIQLHHHWHFAGSSHRLRPGRYDWYVWPRYKGRYHRLVGHGVFYKRAG